MFLQLSSFSTQLRPADRRGGRAVRGGKRVRESESGVGRGRERVNLPCALRGVSTPLYFDSMPSAAATFAPSDTKRTSPCQVYLISPGVICSLMRGNGTLSEFCAALRSAEVSQTDLWLRGR